MTVETIVSKYLSLTETGSRIGKCEATVRNLINAGKLKAGRLRGRLFVHESEVEKYLAARREQTELASTSA